MTSGGRSMDPNQSATPRTWLEERLDLGPSGRREVNRWIMRMHAEPLAAFVRCTRWRALGDPADVVRGFFADRLPREPFLRDWLDSGKTLRKWLGNALVFHLREEVRRRRRQDRARELVEEPVEDLAEAEREMDLAFARRLVRTGLRIARQDLVGRGLGAHYEIFHAHEWQGLSYADAGRRAGVSADRARVMARTARDAFRHAVRELLRRDGSPPSAVDQAIADLLDALD